MRILMMAISGKFEMWEECFIANAVKADRSVVRLDGRGMSHDMVVDVMGKLPHMAQVYVSDMEMDKWNWRQEMLDKAVELFHPKVGDWILFPDEDEKLPDIDYKGRGQMIFQFEMVTDGHGEAFQYPALPHMKAFSYEPGLHYAPYRHCARINGPKGYADISRKELVAHYCFFRKEWRDRKVESINARYPDYFRKYPMKGNMASAKASMEHQSYRDPKRKVGSQSEVPSISFVKGNIRVGGYHKYGLDKHPQFGWCILNPLGAKYDTVAGVLEELQRSKCSSIVDVGCSNGIVSAISGIMGMTTYSLDHDEECISLVRKVADHTKMPINPIKYSFGDAAPAQADAVFALALVHWVWSCTATYGKFSDIIDVLAGMSNRWLVIEWVDPSDQCIRKFGHLSHNADAAREDYTLENFLYALEGMGKVDKVDGYSDTRWMYVVDMQAAMKAPVPVETIAIGSRGNSCSTVTIDRENGMVTKVMNFREPELNKELFEREVYWLDKLQCTLRVPRLISKDPKSNSIVMSYAGEPLTTENTPSDYYQQMMNIMTYMMIQGCYYNDWKSENLLVDDMGRITLIDFGWCPKVVMDFTCGNKVKSELKYKPSGDLWNVPGSEADELPF